MDWSYNEHYTSREAACRDLTAIIRKEIATLVERGARIIQIDEPAFTARPEEYTMFADALKEITRGFNVYFTLHHVYGDLTSYWTKMQSLPVDNFSLDATNSALTIWPLIKKTPPKKDVTVGIVTSESESAEAPRQWLDRARAALKVIPKNQIWFSCNAGLQSHSPDAAILKLRALCDTVKKLRG
jgi:5-methyltetrahydropteroyltriglutamate--homocysteine methyltransferase